MALLFCSVRELSFPLERLLNVKHTRNFYRPIYSIFSLVLLALALLGCSSPTLSAQPTVQAPNIVPVDQPITSTRAPGTAEAAQPPTDPSVVPGTIESTRTPSMSTPTAPSAQLAAALELAAQEMRASERGANLAQAQAHAEFAVNVLVGKFGRWYGDQTGDGTIAGPPDPRGVLPGEKSPLSGADLDQPSQFPFGLALLAAGKNTDSSALQSLLGDPTLWRTRPRAGYDTIAAALADAATDPGLSLLQGSVPRAVAFARLILTTATTPEQARALAANTIQELDSAQLAARSLP